MGLGAKPASPVLRFKIIQQLAQTASKPIKEILLVLYFSLLVVINITYYTIVCFIHTHTYLYILTGYGPMIGLGGRPRGNSLFVCLQNKQ